MLSAVLFVAGECCDFVHGLLNKCFEVTRIPWTYCSYFRRYSAESKIAIRILLYFRRNISRPIKSDMTPEVM